MGVRYALLVALKKWKSGVFEVDGFTRINCYANSYGNKRALSGRQVKPDLNQA